MVFLWNFDQSICDVVHHGQFAVESELVGWLVHLVDIFASITVDSCAECCRAVVANLQADSEADIYCK